MADDGIAAGVQSLEQLSPPQRDDLVHRVFDRVAHRYDVANDVLSLGMHRLWKRAAITMLDPPRSERDWLLLDCASGSGDLLRACARRGGEGVSGIACDINPNMLELARQRLSVDPSACGRAQFTAATATALPFADRTFDAVTIGFGIRNVGDFAGALAEFHRVLKVGGRLICLEFSYSAMAVGGKARDYYLRRLVPLIGRVVTGSRSSYEYLARSIECFPNAEEFPEFLRARGFTDIESLPLSGGVAVVYRAVRTLA